MAALNTADVAALTTAQIVALSTASVAALNTADVAALTTDQVANLTTGDIAVLKTSQIAALNTADVAVLTTAQVVALSTASVAALNTADVAALTTTQVVALTTAGVVALTTTQLSQVLTTDQIVALTTSQVSVLTTKQLMSLSSTQIAAFTTTDVSYLAGFSSPLVLDLNGTGITTQNISAGAQFDLNATGQAVNTGWVTSGEGILVYDPSNGPITSGSQLFGTATVLPNGQKAANGFAALAALDSNGDGVINSSDAGWSNLKVWVGETSSNGAVQGGKLESLDSLGIVQLNLSYTSNPTIDNGNIVGMVSSFVTASGQTHQMADIWFQTGPVQTASASIAPTTPSVQSLATTVALTTSQVAALTTGGQVSALATAQITGLTATQVAALTPNSLTTATGLQSQVGGLAQAIGSFQSQSVAAGSAGVSLVTQPDIRMTGVVGVSVNVSGMVGALQQFGSNGSPVGIPPVVSSVSTTPTSLTVSPLPNPAINGILTTGGK